MNFVKVSENCLFYYNRFCLFIVSVFKPKHWDDPHKCAKENCPFIYWIEKFNKGIEADKIKPKPKKESFRNRALLSRDSAWMK